jgi:hypothetical protein
MIGIWRRSQPATQGWGVWFIRCTLIVGFGLAACTPPTPTPAWSIPRRGTLSELRGIVEIRAADGDAFANAARGSVWDVSAQIRTGADSLARLNLVDGIYLRLGPNTSLINRSLASEWQLELTQGILWSILNARSLTLVTPLGQVTAQGAAATFKYGVGDPADTADDVWVVQCLRGACQFDGGGQSISLGDLGQLTITAGGSKVEQSIASRADVDDFVSNNSEALRLLVNQRAAAPAPSETARSGPEPTATPTQRRVTVPSATPNLTPATDTPTATASATVTSSATSTATATTTRTRTATARPTRKVAPTLRPTATLAPTEAPPTETPSDSGGQSGGGGGGGGQPPGPPPPPAPTSPPEPPERTAPPPKP